MKTFTTLLLTLFVTLSALSDTQTNGLAPRLNATVNQVVQQSSTVTNQLVLVQPTTNTPYSYQWSLAPGGPIADATKSSLVIPNVQSDFKLYGSVSNLYGSAGALISITVVSTNVSDFCSVLITNTTATLVWNYDFNAIPKATGINLYYWPTGGATNLVSLGAVTNYTITGLMTNQVYNFTATAVSPVGVESITSNKASKTTTNGVATIPPTISIVYDTINKIPQLKIKACPSQTVVIYRAINVIGPYIQISTNVADSYGNVVYNDTTLTSASAFYTVR